jgi:hypothetical protein
MSGFFISYRRSDTRPWAGRLHADLVQRFGSSRVFMDVDGIPRGGDLDQILKGKLASCDALVALIGPQWLDCKRSDGRRRLDVPEDWVRTELATALQRGIPIFPVLLGDAKPPADAELPADLHLLCNRLAATVGDDRWQEDTRSLFRDMVRQTFKQLEEPRDVATASAALVWLKDQMADERVADAVIRSREVIEHAYRQFNRLQIFKAIHDALHTIEFECLRPMEAGNSSDPLRLYKRTFEMQALEIQEEMGLPDMDPFLREEIEGEMTLAASAFKSALDAQAGAPQKELLVNQLNLLLSSFPERLNTEIVRAARELNLERIVDLMAKVKDMLPVFPPDQGSPFQPFLDGIKALEGLRDELKVLVEEHSRLQSLDRELRRGCVGGTTARAPKDDWRRIKLVRLRLAPPYSSDLELLFDDLTDLESEIDGTLEKGDSPSAVLTIREYFLFVGKLFRMVDTRLKNFSARLSKVSQPLKWILDMC